MSGNFFVILLFIAKICNGFELWGLKADLFSSWDFLKKSEYQPDLSDSVFVDFLLNQKKMVKKEGNYSCVESLNNLEYIIMHNGTEKARISKEVTKKFFEEKSKIDKSDSYIPFYHDLKGNLQENDLLSFGEWPDEFSVQAETFSFDDVNRITYSFGFLKKWNHVYYGLKLTSTRFNASILEDIAIHKDQSLKSSSWTASLGTYFFKYSCKGNQELFPEYFWLEDDFYELFEDSLRAKYLNIQRSSLSKDYKESLEHHFCFKCGYLNYELILNESAYRFPVSKISFKDLPAVGSSSFSMGLIICDDIYLPEVEFKTGNFDFNQLNFMGYQIPVSLNLLKLQLSYISKESYRISVGSESSLNFYKKEY